ncbi:MAG TPA: GHKL domain-containing protein [bacterium]|nr:GHKL domain-containing protein [bacterium]
MAVNRKRDESLKAGILNLLWLVVLSICLVGLVVLCKVLSVSHIHIVFRALLILSLSFLIILLTNFLFKNSPRVKIYRRQAGQFHAFCRAIKQAAGTLELQEILDSAAKIIVEVAGVRGCSIKLLDSKSGEMKAGTIVGIEPESMGVALNAVESLYQQGTSSREPVIVQDIFMRDFPAVNEEVESLICVPLRLEDMNLGAICIFGARGQKLSAEMISLLSSLGDVVSLSIAHAFMYEDLKILGETKTKFMLEASHELRSPLNSIQSIARTLLEGHLGELGEKQKEMISRIDIRANMLSEIVGDLLVLAMGRAELSAFKPKRVDFAKLLQENVKFFENRAEEREIDMELYTLIQDASVYGSEEGLRSIITNLISNAIKYTPRGGRITLRLFESKDQIVFEISDTGIGIPKAEQERVFREFFRASNAKTASKTGTGLGLAIVKAAVEQHSGTINVESEEGKGTTFRIFLNKAKS